MSAGFGLPSLIHKIALDLVGVKQDANVKSSCYLGSRNGDALCLEEECVHGNELRNRCSCVELGGRRWEVRAPGYVKSKESFRDYYF